eukprot:4041056-Pyramimonas_sp.AAC.1
MFVPRSKLQRKGDPVRISAVRGSRGGAERSWCRGESLAYARAGVHAAHILFAGFLRQVSAPIAFQA